MEKLHILIDIGKKILIEIWIPYKLSFLLSMFTNIQRNTIPFLFFREISQRYQTPSTKISTILPRDWAHFYLVNVNNQDVRMPRFYFENDGSNILHCFCDIDVLIFIWRMHIKIKINNSLIFFREIFLKDEIRPAWFYRQIGEFWSPEY